MHCVTERASAWGQLPRWLPTCRCLLKWNLVLRQDQNNTPSSTFLNLDPFEERVRGDAGSGRQANTYWGSNAYLFCVSDSGGGDGVFFTTNLVRVVMCRRKSDHLSSFHVEPNIFSQVRVCNNMTNNPEMLTDRELEEVTTFFSVHYCVCLCVFFSFFVWLSVCFASVHQLARPLYSVSVLLVVCDVFVPVWLCSIVYNCVELCWIVFNCVQSRWRRFSRALRLDSERQPSTQR